MDTENETNTLYTQIKEKSSRRYLCVYLFLLGL